ncbi:MAG: CAP domain-containing protein [Candidatus Dormibacteria bacterium]
MMQVNSAAGAPCLPLGTPRPSGDRLRRRLTRLLVAGGLAAASCVPGTLLTAVPAHAATAFDAAAAETQMFNLVKQDRAANGQPPVVFNPALSAIARDGNITACGLVVHGRSQDMLDRNYFGHPIPPCGTLVFPSLSSAGFSYSSAGENIAWNNTSPQSTSVDQANTDLMNSPGHRANILGAYNQVGIGVVAASGGYQGYNGAVIYTQIFLQGPLPAPPTPTVSCASTTLSTTAPVLARGGHQLTITNSDGRIEAFGLGADGGLWHSWEGAVNGSWTSWYSLGTMSSGSFSSDPAAGINTDGRLEVFVTGADGSVCHTWQMSPGGGWSQLSSLGGPGSGFAGISSIATNADGRLELFGVGRDGTVWHNWQWAAGGLSGWAGWYSLGGPGGGTFRGAVAPGRNGDGRLEISAVDASGAMWHAWQFAPSSGWTSFYSLHAPSGSVQVMGTPGNVTNADGRLEVMAHGSDNQLWHIWQTSPSGGWGGWYPLGGNIAGDPNAGRNGDGRLEVFATAADGSVVHTWQFAPGSGWTGVYALAKSGTSMSGTPQTGTNVDGTMEAIAQDSLTRTMQVTKQWVPSGGWTPWSVLPGTTFPAL